MLPSQKMLEKSDAAINQNIPMAIVVEEESSVPEDPPSDFDKKEIVKGVFRKAERLQRNESHKSDRGKIRRAHGISVVSPVKIYAGALCTLLFITAIFSSFFVPIYLLVINGFDFFALLPLGVLAIAAILFFSVSISCKCRVCRTSLFSFKGFNRNQGAHHIKGLGYNLSTALHIICFRWFRCQACGTPQKLVKKESK